MGIPTSDLPRCATCGQPAYGHCAKCDQWYCGEHMTAENCPVEQYGQHLHSIDKGYIWIEDQQKRGSDGE